MSTRVLFEKSESLIQAPTTQSKFATLSARHKAVSFQEEAYFAVQILKENDYLAKVASENPDSLISAIYNIASIGLSLNPALKHAYLVPRDKKVCLDPSYKGLVHLAVDAGSVIYAQAELVYEKDRFTLRGRGQEPLHERDPFATDRGEIIGAYCIAEITSGKFLTEPMPIAEINGIRDRTYAYKSYKDGKTKSCPWATDPGEMIKKTVIRRASKSWPMTNTKNDRFEKAIKVYDENEGVIDISTSTTETEDLTSQLNEIRTLLKSLKRDEPKFLLYLSTVNHRKIEKLEDMSKKEAEAALIQLQSWKQMIKPKEVQNAQS